MNRHKLWGYSPNQIKPGDWPAIIFMLIGGIGLGVGAIYWIVLMILITVEKFS